MKALFWFYLLLINLLGAASFYSDKQRARKKQRRISEKRLHVLEALGAIWAMLPMMYLIRHKNRSAAYYRISYLILLLWGLFFYRFFFMLV
jgi:uncharacterized membrane protein YsdA (DUF1294 family)